MHVEVYDRPSGEKRVEISFGDSGGAHVVTPERALELARWIMELKPQMGLQPTGSGIELITTERQRQIDEEGWTPAHDLRHREGSLANAAICYVMYPNTRIFDETWPFDNEWWKPKGRLSNLVRAGALIAAEIDRLQATTNAVPAGERKHHIMDDDSAGLICEFCGRGYEELLAARQLNEKCAATVAGRDADAAPSS